MKFRTMLLASAAVMFASSASAADITAKFFTPAQGGFLSDTTIQTSRTKMDTGLAETVKGKSLKASEKVTYGLTDEVAVYGVITNTFAYDKDQAYNNDHNFDYTVGVKYTTSHDKFLGQVAFDYNTYDPRSWYGKSGAGVSYETNRWAKALNAEASLGYALDCGLTPYTTFKINGTIDRADRDQKYSWFAGAHKMFEKVSVDGGFRYDFGREAGLDRFENWFVQAEANYFVKENITVGVFGDYYLGGKGHHDVDYGYTAGLNAKVLF